MSLHGIDVADVNASATVHAALASHNNEFALIKATEGHTFVDTDHKDYVAKARADKKAVGHYHFANPVTSAVTEADFFLKHAAPVAGDVLALDLESGGTSWSQRALYALTWLSHVKAKTGAHPLIYMNQYWATNVYAALNGTQRAELLTYPLWIADPSAPAGHPNTGAWKTWTVHQYGIVGGLDNDMFNGDLHTWASLAVPAPKKPTPPPAPAPTPAPTPVPAPAPAPSKGYNMVIFGQNVDSLTAAAATDAFQPKGTVATGRVDVAKAALTAGDVVIAVGGPANTALGFTHAKAGQVVVSGKQVAIQGATASDSYVLLGRYLATGK